MLPIKTLVKRVRRFVHDTDAVTYDDDEIVTVLNSGIRFIRKTIADIRPENLAEDVISGTLEPGEGSISLPWRPLVYLYVRTGDEVASSEELTTSDKVYHNRNLVYHNKTPVYGKYTVTEYKTYKIPEVSMSQIHGDLRRQGKPEVFYSLGAQTVKLYPVPDAVTAYDILAVQDFEELTINDNSPLLTEFDDVLVEYANMRLCVENEYDVSQDNQMMNGIYQQIVRLLRIPPTGVTVQGYWDRSLNSYGKPVNRGAW